MKSTPTHISSLYSPVGWFSWADAAKMWDDAQKDNTRLKVFINTVLGETWEDRGEVPEYKRLLDRREHYAAHKVPMGRIFLTAGTDVQKDRIEVSVWAWGRNRQCWLIAHVVLDGSTGDQPVWDKLTELLGTSFEHEPGSWLIITRMAIDTGFRTQECYAWVRQHGVGRAFALKGSLMGRSMCSSSSSQLVKACNARI